MDKHINHHLTEEELEKSAPLLFGLKSKPNSEIGFQVPEGYFDSLPSDVMLKIESSPDFEASQLANPYKTPEGYFDSLPSIVQQRIYEQSKKKRILSGLFPQIFSNQVPRFSLAIASLLLIVLFSIKYFNRTIKVEYVNSDQETEQLESFYLSQLDETVLLEAYSEEQVTSDNNEIENYLIENNIDLNLISEHL